MTQIIPIKKCPWGCTPKTRSDNKPASDPRFPDKTQPVVFCDHAIMLGEEKLTSSIDNWNDLIVKWNSYDLSSCNDILRETLTLLNNLPRHISFVKIAEESKCSVSWLSRLAAGKFKDPSIRPIQRLYNYLKGMEYVKG